MATFTAKAARRSTPIRAVKAGVNVAFGRYVTSATLSAGDVLEMCKVPNHAEIMDVSLFAKGRWDLLLYASVGDDDLANRFINQRPLIVTDTPFISRLHTELGYQYEISDDVADQFKIINATITTATGTATASTTVCLVVKYTLPGD